MPELPEVEVTRRGLAPQLAGRKISGVSVRGMEIIDRIMELPAGTRLQLLAPVIRGRKGEYAKLFEEVGKEGFARVRVDGEIRELREKIDLDKKKKHTIEVVELSCVDRRRVVDQQLLDLEPVRNLLQAQHAVDSTPRQAAFRREG